VEESNGDYALFGYVAGGGGGPRPQFPPRMSGLGGSLTGSGGGGGGGGLSGIKFEKLDREKLTEVRAEMRRNVEGQV
jgi:hypothetical protein